MDIVKPNIPFEYFGKQVVKPCEKITGVDVEIFEKQNYVIQDVN